MSPVLDVTQALIGNRGDHDLGTTPESGVGFELVTRAAFLVLATQLNDEIQRQADRWHAADSAMQAAGFDPGVGQVDIPPIPDANFHEGPHRSLLKSPPSAFPNISVMAYMTVPSPSQAFDQLDSSDITLFVETTAISGPVPDGLEVIHESIVHRRIQRMTEAVAIVIGRNKTLLGTAHDLRTPPRGGIGNSSWLRRDESGAGQNYIWHGSRLQYTLQRHHATF